MEFLPLIKKHIGTPHFIWTHRDPAECIPSFLSMVSHSRSIFSNDVRLNEVVEHWLKKTSYMLEKGLEYRNEGENDEQFTDIKYKLLVKNPLSELEKIYKRYGGLPKNLKESFKVVEQNNPQGKYGIHEYSYKDFGLTKDDLLKNNSAYYSLYNTLSTVKKEA